MLGESSRLWVCLEAKRFEVESIGEFDRSTQWSSATVEQSDCLTDCLWIFMNAYEYRFADKRARYDRYIPCDAHHTEHTIRCIRWQIRSVSRPDFPQWISMDFNGFHWIYNGFTMGFTGSTMDLTGFTMDFNGFTMDRRWKTMLLISDCIRDTVGGPIKSY